jgi:hypothetical protein
MAKAKQITTTEGVALTAIYVVSAAVLAYIGFAIWSGS